MPLDPPPPPLSRRTFLLVAAAAWARPAWAVPGPAGGGGALRLRVPRVTRNGAKVPVVLESAHPMAPDHHVTTVRVANPSDPISSKGTFHFTPANGRVFLAYQVRMHDGASEVTATGECSRGHALAGSAPIEIPPGAGGCAGGSGEVARTSGADVAGPAIRIAELVERGRVRPGELVHVQVKMRHPNRTGLALRNGTFVAESSPIHLEAIEVFYDDEPVSRFVMTPALSDDPFITFGLLVRRAGDVKVIVTNSRGERFEATQALRVA